jgi:hypothetical protein
MSAPRSEESAGGFRSRLEPVNWYLAAALIFSIVAAWPLLSDPGFLNTRGGGDSPFLLQRVQQLGVALADGHFPVRWMPDASYGYGYPFFNYYAPLSIYLAASLNFIGFGLVWAIKLIQLLGFIVAAWAMFSLGRRWLNSNWAGLLASTVYTLAPFHMVNVYVRGDSLAEFWAMAFYPLVILLADNLTCAVATGDMKATRTAVVMFGLGYAALILSHNISALIFTPFLILYFLLALWRQKTTDEDGISNNSHRKAILKWSFLALILALALSAWFWLPAISERSLAQLEPVTSGYFHYDNHFRDADLVQPTVIFDYDVADGKAFRMGLVQALLALTGLAVILADVWRSRKDGAKSNAKGISPVPGIFILLSFVLATFMIVSLSRSLWDNLPFLSYTQFPWRFLSIQAFAAALAIAGLSLIPGRRYVVPGILVLMIVTSLASLKPDFINISDDDVTAEKLTEYEWFTGNIGTTVSAEYLPLSAVPRPFTSRWLNDDQRNAVQQLQGEIQSVALINRRAAQQTWALATAAPVTVVTFPTLYWPGWKAELDGEPLDIEPAPGSGLISAAIPIGSHEVRLRLARTPVRRVAELVSIVAILVTGWLLITSSRRTINWKSVGLALLCLSVAVVILVVWPGRDPSEDDLSWDFPQLAYLHQATDTIAFDDGTALQSYSYSRDEMTAGDELTITLNWESSPDAALSIALATPAINRYPHAPLLAAQTIVSADNKISFRLRIPENAPAGLYVPRLVIEGAHSVTSSGQERGDLFLRPVRIVDRSDFTQEMGPDLDARPTGIRQRNADQLDVQLQWLTRQAIMNNYNYSLRLVDSEGVEISQFDSQPGYGYLPSSGWRPGSWIDDWQTLSLPQNIESSYPKSPYSLVVRLYDVGTGEVVLIRRLGELGWQNENLESIESNPIFALPNNIQTTDVTFDEEIRLGGYDLQHSGDSFLLNLYWQSLAAGHEDYFHFVHLIDLETGEIVAQHDSMPRNDTYPTSQWLENEVVSDPVSVDIGDIPAGNYLIAIGMYRDLGSGDVGSRFPRLSAENGDGRQLPDDRIVIAFDLKFD